MRMRASKMLGSPNRRHVAIPGRIDLAQVIPVGVHPTTVPPHCNLELRVNAAGKVPCNGLASRIGQRPNRSTREPGRGMGAQKDRDATKQRFRRARAATGRVNDSQRRWVPQRPRLMSAERGRLTLDGIHRLTRVACVSWFGLIARALARIPVGVAPTGMCALGMYGRFCIYPRTLWTEGVQVPCDCHY